MRELSPREVKQVVKGHVCLPQQIQDARQVRGGYRASLFHMGKLSFKVTCLVSDDADLHFLVTVQPEVC